MRERASAQNEAAAEVKGAIRTRGQKEEKGLDLREERDCAPRGAHFSLGKRNARAGIEKSRERRRRNQSCDKSERHRNAKG